MTDNKNYFFFHARDIKIISTAYRHVTICQLANMPSCNYDSGDSVSFFLFVALVAMLFPRVVLSMKRSESILAPIFITKKRLHKPLFYA